jgi:hypothetical protein
MEKGSFEKEASFILLDWYFAREAERPNENPAREAVGRARKTHKNKNKR